MKKKLLCLVSCFFVFFLISCSSIPKKANADDAIVIGEVSIFFPEDDLYAGNHDTKASGSIRNGIEVAIENTKSKTLISTRTDEKGFFVFKNLNPNSSYRIVKVSFAKGGSSSVVTRSVNFNSYPPFTPTEGCVTNLGVAQYTWQDDKIYTKYYPNTIVHARFEELAAESEWLSKPIVDIYNY